MYKLVTCLLSFAFFGFYTDTSFSNEEKVNKDGKNVEFMKQQIDEMQ